VVGASPTAELFREYWVDPNYFGMAKVYSRFMEDCTESYHSKWQYRLGVDPSARLPYHQYNQGLLQAVKEGYEKYLKRLVETGQTAHSSPTQAEAQQFTRSRVKTPPPPKEDTE
jgi:hypothetical protein